jgi:hypothetical protein
MKIESIMPRIQDKKTKEAGIYSSEPSTCSFKNIAESN